MGPGDHLERVKRAIEQAEADGDSRKEAGLLESLGDLYLTSDAYGQALGQFDRLVRSPHWASFTPADKARILYKTARTHLGLGEYDQALRLTSKAELLLTDEDDPLLLGRIYSLCGQVHRRIGNQSDALAYSLRAFDVLRHTDANREIAFVQLTCGSIFLRQGSFSDAVRYFHDSLATYRRIDDEEGIAKAYNNLGVAYKNLCQWESATGALKKAMEIDRRFGNYAGVALRMLNLGLIQFQRGEWDSSHRRFEKSLQMFRGVKDMVGVTLCSLALARLARHRRRWEEARRLATDALRDSMARGNRREIAASYEEIGAWYFARGQTRTARAFFEKSLTVAEKISEKNDHIAEIHRRLSEVASAEGRPEAGIAYAKHGLRTAAAIKDKRLVGLGLRALAAATRLAGRPRLAAFYARRSVRVFGEFGMPFDLGRSLLESAVIARENDDIGAARAELTRAEEIFRGLGAEGYAVRVLIEFAEMKVRTDRLEDGLVLLHKAQRTVDRDFPSGDLEDIQRLQTSIENRFVEVSTSPSNRYLAFQESSAASREETLDRILAELEAGRAFFFRRNAVGGWEIVDGRGVDPEEARHLLQGARSDGSATGPIRPMVSLGDVGGGTSLSLLVAPAEGGEAGVYVDRPVSCGRRPFGRRDLNYLVGVARELVVGGVKMDEAIVGAPHGAAFDGVVTQSEKMQDILAMLRKLEGVNASILIQGETGTGKGLLAYEISKGDSEPFVTINCADLTETILESELFGHVKNAFTGAGRGKKGLFEVADGGTVFIDEIDKTSRHFQEKLLRVVDRREFKPVGSVEVSRVDCRIICASNRDLAEEVERRRFLKDLYYRLKVISITLPPLRERSVDIPPLVDHFVAKYTRSMGKAGVSFEPAVVELFSRYHWPGNIRDLQNEVERAVALASPGDVVTIDSLSDELVRFSKLGVTTPVTGEKSLANMVGELEERVIREALRRCHGNKSQVARLLGLTRKGLRNKILRHGLE
ncbi:MAG: sigma 54-interacting transcriptional regulator [Candidatus Eisenbacteria bacterium]